MKISDFANAVKNGKIVAGICLHNSQEFGPATFETYWAKISDNEFEVANEKCFNNLVIGDGDIFPLREIAISLESVADDETFFIIMTEAEARKKVIPSFSKGSTVSIKGIEKNGVVLDFNPEIGRYLVLPENDIDSFWISPNFLI